MRDVFKKYLFFAAIFIGGLCLAKSLQQPGRQIIKLTDADAGKQLVVKKGQIFMLTLPDHVDGGYRFDTIQYNAAIVTLQKHSENPPQPNSPPGRSGTGTWHFIAVNKGKTTLRVSATRPWKGGGTVTVFENEVVVK
jgi:predicted secreted protein